MALDWVARPPRAGLVDRARQLARAIPAWLRRRLGGSDAACPFCLQAVRANSRRCPRCRENLTLDDPLAALDRLGLTWPAPELVLQPVPELGDVESERLRLRELVEEVLLARGNAYDVLRCLADHRLHRAIDRYPHQIETVRRVLGELGGRAILADEVGLGKTIEAGLVLAELRARQLCRHALILVPPALVEQWHGELGEKLGLPVTLVDAPSVLGEPPEIALLSLYTARGPRYRQHLAQREWDLVIVDEAHRLRNPRTQLHAFIRGLRARGLLLLTATPIHSSVHDLYALVHLVRPGLLGTPAAFRRTFGVRQRGRTLRNDRQLRSVLREVMIRNRRSTSGVALPPRAAAIQWVTLSPEEKILYQRATAQLRSEQHPGSPFSLARASQLQRRITSTPRAARSALSWIAEPAGHQSLEDLLREASVGQKVLALEQLCLLFPDEQVLVFSEFPESVEAVAEHLSRCGERVAHWHGGMAGGARLEALQSFRAGKARVLVGSDALAEGQNLQHCRLLVNLDLPWNPFRIEQRIGRVHRLGQRREVFVVTLVARETIEADLADLLVRKLRLFELAVGELDPILGDLGQSDVDFEHFLLKVALADEHARERELSTFANLLEDAYLRHRTLAERQEVLPDLSSVRE